MNITIVQNKSNEEKYSSVKIKNDVSKFNRSSTNKNISNTRISKIVDTPNYFFKRREQISELFSRRLRWFLGALLLSVICDVFLAKPILHHAGTSEVQLLQDLMSRSGVITTTFENTTWFDNSPWVLLNSTIPRSLNRRGDSDPTVRPGAILSQHGAKAKYPVVMIPGFITSGLELWAGEECAKKYFRQRIWGSLPVFVQSFLTDNACYQKHMALDPITGSDPPNIKLRNVQGFEAADFFMSTVWVFDKLIESFADVGYDTSNMVMMSFDWRLSFHMLEERDGYFTKLKLNVEALVRTHKEKVVITSHSMGSQIVLYFLTWVTTDEKLGGGGGGPDWVENHIHSFVNIAGPLLGVSKAASALLSGEFKDTSELMGPMGVALERVFSRKNRKHLYSTWGSLWEMLPIGGDAVWGITSDIITNEEDNIEVSQCLDSTNSQNICMLNDMDKRGMKRSPLISFTDNSMIDVETGAKSDAKSDYHNILSSNNTGFLLKDQHRRQPQQPYDDEGQRMMQDTKESWTADDTIEFLRRSGDGFGRKLHGASLFDESRKKHDPLSTPLPYAPSMKLYCLYGAGIPTERAYFYKQTQPTSGRAPSIFQSSDLSDYPPFVMDSSVNDNELNINFGVRFSDGDVSVPLISLGYMCADAWRNSSELNPSNIDIVTREYYHKEDRKVTDPMRRGGPHSSNHVDILGNVDTTMDLLKIATGFQTEEVQDKFVSDIHKYADEINSSFVRKKRILRRIFANKK